MLHFLGGLLLWLPANGASEAAPFTGASTSKRDRHVEARLLSNRSHITPGESWWVALELKHDPTWHTYWKNGGDAGVPTLIKWTLPEGITAGPIKWEVPQIVKMGRLDVYGYEGTCLLLTEFKSNTNAPENSQIVIEAFANWMMCSQTCLPGQGVNLQLKLGVDHSGQSNRETKWSERIQRAVNELPGSAPEGMFKGKLDPELNQFHLFWESFPKFGEIEDVYYFDLTEQVTSDEPQTLEQTAHGWRLSLPRASYASKIPSVMRGCLRWKLAGEDFQWFQLEIPLK